MVEEDVTHKFERMRQKLKEMQEEIDRFEREVKAQLDRLKPPE